MTDWYPSRAHFKTDEEYQAHRISYQQQYALRDRVNKLEQQSKPAPEEKNGMKPGGPSSTQIAGYNVSGSPSAATPNLKYNPATGQIEWSS